MLSDSLIVMTELESRSPASAHKSLSVLCESLLQVDGINCIQGICSLLFSVVLCRETPLTGTPNNAEKARRGGTCPLSSSVLLLMTDVSDVLL